MAEFKVITPSALTGILLPTALAVESKGSTESSVGILPLHVTVSLEDSSIKAEGLNELY